MTSIPKYGKVIDTLKERLLAELKDEIHSLVLFGSVARGDATDDSDIDILVIMDAPYATKKRIHEISSDIGLDNEVFIQTVFFTTQGFEKEAITYRSYFAQDIISQGIVLYDDETFRRICEEAASAISGIPG